MTIEPVNFYSVGVSVGETIRYTAPAPMKWFDKALWKLFRINRKRKEVVYTATVSDVFVGGD